MSLCLVSGPWGHTPTKITISLLRRLAALYPDGVIAGILNRLGRRTATGKRFTANRISSLRRYRNIPRFQPLAQRLTGELVTIRRAAQILGMNKDTNVPPASRTVCRMGGLSRV